MHQTLRESAVYAVSVVVLTPPEQAEVEALGERIAELSAQIAAATYELLVMIREFDERGGWGCGFRTCAHWLNWRTGLELGAAREKVRVARALVPLPELSESMRRGELSYSKVRALTRIATPANEAELLIFAKAGTASHVEKLVRACRRVDRLAEAEHERLRYEGRSFHAWTDEDGMVVVSGRLTAEAGAALLRALDAASGKLYEPRPSRDPAGETTAEQRRADALGLVAQSALAAGLDPGTRGDRFQVVLHVDAEALAMRPAVASLDASSTCCSHVSAETSRLAQAEMTADPNVSAETSLERGSRSMMEAIHVSAETFVAATAAPPSRDCTFPRKRAGESPATAR